MPGIQISANFDLGTGIPLDSRLVQADVTARNALNTITQRYEGMVVFTVATQKNYQLRGGVADANWTEMIDTGEPALGNPGTTGFVLSSTTAGVRSWVAPSSGMTYPATGIPNSTGSAWTTSYTVTGTGTVVALQTSPLFITQVVMTEGGKIGFRYSAGDPGPYHYITANGATALEFHNTYTSSDANKLYSFFKGTSTQTEIVTFLASGNVGIGTAVPIAKLSLAAASSDSGDQFTIGVSSTDHLGIGYTSAGQTIGFIGVNFNDNGARFDIRMKGQAATDAKLTVLGSGNVGIGTTAPVHNLSLDVNYKLGWLSATDAASRRWALYNNATVHGDFNIAQSTTQNGTTYSVKMYFDAAGNVGINNIAPSKRLEISGVDNDGMAISYTGGLYRHTITGYFSSDNQGRIDFNPYNGSSQTTRMSIRGDGNIGFGTTAPYKQFHIYGANAGFALQSSTSPNDHWLIRAMDSNNSLIIGNDDSGYGTVLTILRTGVATFNYTVTATNFILSSDERLKTNITSFNPHPINVEYKRFEMKNESGQIRYGVIAQDLQKNYPDLVRTGQDGFLSVSYFDLMIREIVYLKDKVKELEGRLG